MVRCKRWDPDSKMQQVWKQPFLFLYHTIQPDYSHLNILPRTIFLKTTNTLSTLSKCLPVAAHLAPAPAAAIVAPAQAAATKLPSQCANPPPSARHWEATTGRTSTGPSRSVEGAMQSHGKFITSVRYLP
ncbi:hypothetical protein E4U32_000532 [Claviceps aff. humidiphila group G2b]|nr:hypothetical protein E4U32_000532 [Claviceps aff. humidiphila group G2b]